MSLILEALRKSEAERRRGQAPQLFDPPAAALPATPKRSPRALWWTLPVALSAALLVLWRYAATPPVADAAAPAHANADDGAARVEPIASMEDRPSDNAGTNAPIEAAAMTRPAETAIAAAPRPVPVPPADPEPARVEPTPAPHGPVEPARVDRAPAAMATAARPEPATAPFAAPVPLEPPVPTARPSRTAAAEPARPLPASPQPAVAASSAQITAPPAATVEPRPPPVSNPGPQRLADLTPAQRRSLPPLKMSMHMWSADAAQRFVILDGARMGEGDRVGEAVIDEITQDGAILAWDGRRVKVPVR